MRSTFSTGRQTGSLNGPARRRTEPSARGPGPDQPHRQARRPGRSLQNPSHTSKQESVMTNGRRIPTWPGRGHRDREAGAAMLVAVMVITAVAVLSASIAVLATRSTRAAGETRTAGVVKDLANAGLAEGVTYLRQVGVTSAIDAQPAVPGRRCVHVASQLRPRPHRPGPRPAPRSSMPATRASTGVDRKGRRHRAADHAGAYRVCATGHVRPRASAPPACALNTPQPPAAPDLTPSTARATSSCSLRPRSSETCRSTARPASTARATSRPSVARI